MPNLVALVRQDFDAPTASRAVLYALVFPSSLFLSAVYPHALFLAGAIGAVYHARRGQWWLAGGLAAFAALAGVHGCVIVIPLAFEYLAAPGFGLNPVRIDRASLRRLVRIDRASLRRHVRIDRANVRRLVHSDALALLLPLASAGAFAIVLWLQAGDPLAMLGAGSQWQRHFGAPWAPFLTYLRDGLGAHGSNTSPLDLAFTLLLIALVALSWVRVRRSLALFATLLLLISLSSGLLVSSMRYGLELFPIFIVLAVSGRNRLCHFAYLGSSAYLALRFMSEFAQSIWVA